MNRRACQPYSDLRWFSYHSVSHGSSRISENSLSCFNFRPWNWGSSSGSVLVYWRNWSFSIEQISCCCSVSRSRLDLAAVRLLNTQVGTRPPGRCPWNHDYLVVYCRTSAAGRSPWSSCHSHYIISTLYRNPLQRRTRYGRKSTVLAVPSVCYHSLFSRFFGLRQ